jgi:hypothetical protein
VTEPHILYSSEGIGTDNAYYSVTKFNDRIRKQWALTVHTPGLLEIAAYFRSEEAARKFAAVMTLEIKEARRG